MGPNQGCGGKGSQRKYYVLKEAFEISISDFVGPSKESFKTYLILYFEFKVGPKMCERNVREVVREAAT